MEDCFTLPVPHPTPLFSCFDYPRPSILIQFHYQPGLCPPPPLPYQDPFPAFHFIITSPASALKTTSSPPLNNKPNKVGLHWNNLHLGEKCEGILMSLSNNDLICIYILFTATFDIATLGPMYLESHKQLRCSKCCMQGCHCYQ